MAGPIDAEKLQKCIEVCEKNNTYSSPNELFEACAGTKWAIKNGYTKGAIYARVNALLKAGTPLVIKTKAARIRKGGMSEKLAAPEPTPPPQPQPSEAKVETTAGVINLAAVTQRNGETREQALERTVVALRNRFAVYIGEGQAFHVNPRSVVRCAATGDAGRADTQREADPLWEKFIDGLRAGHEMLKLYHELSQETTLNPFDVARCREAKAALDAFLASNRVASLTDTHKFVGQGKGGRNEKTDADAG